MKILRVTSRTSPALPHRSAVYVRAVDPTPLSSPVVLRSEEGRSDQSCC